MNQYSLPFFTDIHAFFVNNASFQLQLQRLLAFWPNFSFSVVYFSYILRNFAEIDLFGPDLQTLLSKMPNAQCWCQSHEKKLYLIWWDNSNEIKF